MTDDRTSIPVSKPVQRRIKSMKRGGESYDELISKMADAYEVNEPDGIR